MSKKCFFQKFRILKFWKCKVFEFCASAKNFSIILSETTHFKLPKTDQTLRRKWTLRGLRVDSKRITIGNFQKIADKSRDIHRIIFLRPYSNSALKTTPTYKFSVISEEIWKFHFFLSKFWLNFWWKNEFSPKSLKIRR